MTRENPFYYVEIIDETGSKAEVTTSYAYSNKENAQRQLAKRVLELHEKLKKECTSDYSINVSRNANYANIVYYNGSYWVNYFFKVKEMFFVL